MDRPELYVVLFGSLFQDRNVFRIERALAGVIQHIPGVVNVGMFRAVIKLRLLSIDGERQVPKLNAVIRLITYRKALVFQKFRIGKEWFLLCGSQNAQPLFSLRHTVFDAGVQKVRGIAVALE